MKPYNNLRAMRALIRASLQAIIKSPSAVFFGLAFPIIFILVFGLMEGGGGSFHIPVMAAPGSDTNNIYFKALKSNPVLTWDLVQNTISEQKHLEQGDVIASIAVIPQPAGSLPRYKVVLKTSLEGSPKFRALIGMLEQMNISMNPDIQAHKDDIATITTKTLTFREYKYIDFLLPGQLGFSLLMGSIFGTAFVFYNLRNTLVLKRFFATPVRRGVIVVSEGIARMLFQLMTAVIIIAFGHFFFDFTLLNGFATFIQLIFLSALGIMVFMSFGFIISGVVKSDASIPMLSNLIGLPQVFLSGTFFETTAYPNWLQMVSKCMPLKYLNDAMRKVSYEGASLWDVRVEILVLTGFCIVLYFIAGKVFKWE